MILKHFLVTFTTLMLAISMTACNQVKQESMPSAKADTVGEIFEVHEDGRIYAFYDYKLYKEFLSVGETAYRLTRIGTGPNGETMVFGLTKKDKKKGADTPAVKLFENKASPSDKFYAETTRHGRIYIFNNFADMQTVRQFGHPNFFYTEIGSGPKGETVVYVLNKKTKKKKPVELIAAFKKHNSNT